MRRYKLSILSFASTLIGLLAISQITIATEAGNGRGSWAPIPDHVWSAMQNKSWHPGFGCPGRKKLALLSLPYRDFNGQMQTGRLIAARDVADDLVTVFEKMFRSGFQIQQMRLVHRFGGNDNRSMNANNTSAFNCRKVTGGRRLSQHSFGRAIDINPVQNPYVRKHITQPAAGRRFASPRARRAEQPGLIRKGDKVTKAFALIGWKWGGNWRSLKDYQHFSKSGR